MAVSLATRVTPYMGQGRPRVVIRGQFALGLAPGATNTGIPTLQLVNRLHLTGVATARYVSVSDYDAFSVTVQRSNLSDFQMSYMGSLPDAGSAVYNNYDDVPCAPLASSLGTGTYDGQYWSEATYSDTAGCLAAALSDYNAPVFGLPLPVVVEIDGKLTSLDLDALYTTGYFYGHNGQGANSWRMTAPDTLIPASSYDDYYQDGRMRQDGWSLDRVDIYDQQQLRGHVTGGTGKITWH